eukprot:m.242531 g.242531  ORF g.242531 m.242531 type:complete len:204 (-) comp14052_c0_seq1:94-705(-)
MPHIAIIYYSMYGHVRVLAQAVQRGVEATGATADLFQVPETLPEDVLAKMTAPPKSEDPVFTHDMLDSLKDYDGILFGIPTRYGMMSAQMKAFFDSTVRLWNRGDLLGKPAGIFTSVGTQGGGQETTALTTITQLTHHGMIFVPTGYGYGAPMYDMASVHGGTAYGAGTFVGDGSRWPTEGELGYAEYQGRYFSGVAKKLAGR